MTRVTNPHWDPETATTETNPHLQNVVGVDRVLPMCPGPGEGGNCGAAVTDYTRISGVTLTPCGHSVDPAALGLSEDTG